jgi:hypothetical protein
MFPITELVSDSESLSDSQIENLGILISAPGPQPYTGPVWELLAGFLPVSDSNVPTDGLSAGFGFGSGDSETFTDNQNGIAQLLVTESDSESLSDNITYSVVGVILMTTPYRHLHMGLNRGIN